VESGDISEHGLRCDLTVLLLKNAGNAHISRWLRVFVKVEHARHLRVSG
jgi:hypothetical protein